MSGFKEEVERLRAQLDETLSRLRDSMDAPVSEGEAPLLVAHSEDRTLYTRSAGAPPQRMVAVPLIAREKVVAVLYADSAGQDADAINLEALETLARVAGMSVELLALRRSSPQPSAATSTQ